MRADVGRAAPARSAPDARADVAEPDGLSKSGRQGEGARSDEGHDVLLEGGGDRRYRLPCRERGPQLHHCRVESRMGWAWLAAGAVLLLGITDSKQHFLRRLWIVAPAWILALGALASVPDGLELVRLRFR